MEDEKKEGFIYGSQLARALKDQEVLVREAHAVGSSHGWGVASAVLFGLWWRDEPVVWWQPLAFLAVSVGMLFFSFYLGRKVTPSSEDDT